LIVDSSQYLPEIVVDMHRILALWAHPRSLSTALERILIERGDFEVMHEPFSVVYYLHERRSYAAHANFDSAETADYDSIRNKIVQAANRRPVCFKDMCYHCHDHVIGDDAFLERITNVFLIRDPRQAIASHYAKNPHVTSEEIGYEKQANVFRKVTQLTGAPPAVIAAEDLQQNPTGLLSALWHRIGAEDRPEAINWQAGHREQWDHWKQWHREVAQSSGIQPGQTDYAETVDNHSKLSAFYNHHRPFHDEMYSHRLVPGRGG
jgi:hypothetical protein